MLRSFASTSNARPLQKRVSDLGYIRGRSINYSYLGGAALLLFFKGECQEEKQPWPENPEVHFKHTKFAHSLASKSAVLNLQDVEVDKRDLEILSNCFETHHHPFIRVIWGNIADGSSEEVEKVETLLGENSSRWKDRPKPYYCARFAKLAYSSKKELEKGCGLPEGWSFFDSRDNSEKNGYFGAAFVNHSTGQIILAHRGTHSIVKDLQTDVLGVVKGVVEGQQESALEFTKDVLQEADKKGYRLGFVGHSLGGWLAQLTTAWCKAQGVDDVYAVTMDAPGAKGMLKSYLDGRAFIPMADMDSDGIDLTNYLSLPNLVNSCNEQTGDIFHILPVFGSGEKKIRDWVSLGSWASWGLRFLKDIDYLSEAHSLDNQLAAFDPLSGKVKKNKIFQVVSWPDLGKMQKYHTDFFRVVRENREILPYTENIKASKQPYLVEVNYDCKDHENIERDRSLKDRYIVEKIGRYSVRDFMPNEMRLQHFSKRAQTWLTRVASKSDDLPRMEKVAGLEGGELTERLKFTLNRDGLVVAGSGDSWEFRNNLERLLKAFPVMHLLATDLEWDLSGEEIALLLDSQERELIRFCQNVVPARLYLFNPAGSSEIKKHADEIKVLEVEIQKRKDLLEKISDKEFWKNELSEQIGRLQIMELISKAFEKYKLREFDQAEKVTDELLLELDKYQKSSTSFTAQLPRLTAGIYSLKAKIDRCNWKDEADLESSKANYLAALDEDKGLPKVAAIWSNYGALLNNWGEWLFWEGRIDEALKKHEEALKIHEKAHELALEGEWLYQDKNYENFPPGFIRRDYARGLFLLAEIEHTISLERLEKAKEGGEKGKLEEEIRYKTELEHILTLFSLDSVKDVPPTTWLFKGIIYKELGEYSKAQICYSRGLKKEKSHATLLNRMAEYYHLCKQKEPALKFANLSLESLKKRGINTPEDRHRFRLAKERMEKIRDCENGD